MNSQDSKQDLVSSLRKLANDTKLHKQRQGELPMDRKSKEELVRRFKHQHFNHDEGGVRDKKVIYQALIPPPYPPCTASLDDLKPISISELNLEIHHRGTSLFLRAITHAVRLAGITFVAEDAHGDAVTVILYHQQPEHIRRASDIVHVGTIALVKYPYFEMAGAGEYRVRVDHLSDVVFVRPNDDRLPEAWKLPECRRMPNVHVERGEGDIGRGDFWGGIAGYTTALSMLQPTMNDASVLRRKRARAYLTIQSYDGVLCDAGYKGPSESGPARWDKNSDLRHVAEALYHLGRIGEAALVMQTLCVPYPNEVTQRQRDYVLARQIESETGTYEFLTFQERAKTSTPPILNHVSYIGPVETRDVSGKGRGLFVTHAVKAGDLILCEKAFGYVHVPANHASSSFIALMHMETGKVVMNEQVDLWRGITHKLHQNPSLAPNFMTLCRGDYPEPRYYDDDGNPITDTFLVERIISLNAFGHWGVSSLARYKANIRGTRTKESEAYSCGIWVKASSINHSCMHNAERALIGDMMIVRATQDLDAGTELRVSYKDPFRCSHGKQQRQGDYEAWGFVCDCGLCEDFRTIEASVVDKRTELWTRVETLRRQENPFPIHAIDQTLQSMNDTYTKPADEVPRIQLRNLLVVLVPFYARKGEHGKVLEYVGMVLTSLCFIAHGVDTSPTPFTVERWGLVGDHLVEDFLHAGRAFEVLGRPADAVKANEYAKLVYRMLVGEDDTLESVYPRQHR